MVLLSKKRNGFVLGAAVNNYTKIRDRGNLYKTNLEKVKCQRRSLTRGGVV